MRNCIIFTIIPQNSTIFKTIDDETTISGQRIVGALQARKIAQQQATAQLEVDIACLKKYEIACQSGSVSTEQFDSIMKKASVTAKEYTVNIQKGTGSAQAYTQSQKANNAALQSVGIGAGIASKAVKLLSATMNTIAFTAIFSLISKGISWVTEQINNYIHRNEIAIEKAEELLNTFKSEIDEITSKQDKINGYADEFKELSEGVDDLGRKVSLTADEYSRYQNIVKEIVGINPGLISGYDEENNILADKNGLLETSIQLLKDEYNQKLKNLALPNNIDTAIEGAIGRYNSSKEDFLEVEIPTSLAFSGVKIDEHGNRETGYVNQISKYIEDVIGVEFTGWEGGINQYILDNAEAVFDNLDKIKERASQTKDGWEGLNDSQLIDLMDYFRELRIAYNDMNNATTSANPTLQYVAMAEDSYSQLTDIQKKFIADYVNGIQVTSETTEQEKDNIRKSIISLTQELSNLNDINVNNALIDLYAIPTDKQSVSELVDQFRSALEIVKAYCEENGIEIPIAISDSEQSINDLEAQYQRAVDFAKDKFDGYDPTAFFNEYSINTQEEIDAWQGIAQGARDAAEAEKEYIQSSTLNTDPTSFSSALTSSQDSLDNIQSSVKSASEAYTTLLTGNYSSSELLDSIQALNNAASDMGKSIDWESISASADPLQAIQDEIESISTSYFNSVLSGAGLNNDFGQMLANIVQESYKSEAALSSLNTQIDSLQSAYGNLTDIVETYNETGYITFDQLQTLLAMEPQYLSCLMDENGQLLLNQESMLALANQRLNDAEAQAVQQAISELGQLALQDEKTAVEENAQAFSNAVNDLAGYNNKLAETIGMASVGSSVIRDLNNEISDAKSRGASDTQINSVLDNLETKLQLIKNTRTNLSNSLGNIVGKSSSGSSSSTKSEFQETIDFFKQRVEVLDDALSHLSTTMDNISGSFAKNNLIDAELGITGEKFNNYTDALAMYTQKANEAFTKIPADIVSMVKDGAVALTDFVGDGNEEVVEAIKDYESWADKIQDCKKELAELQKEIRQLELEKFNNIMDDYENQFNLRGDSKDLISKQIDLLKAAGELIGESFFTAQIDQSKKQLELLENEKAQLVNQMSSAISSGRVNCCPLLQ